MNPWLIGAKTAQLDVQQPNMKLFRRLWRSAIYRLKKRTGKLPPYPYTLNPSGTPRGRVLFSYVPDVLRLPEDAPEFDTHTSRWHARTIGHLFVEMGYIVDGVRWDDQVFLPQRDYDVVFDIYINLVRWLPYLKTNTIKLLHCTGSDPYYQNSAELQRIDALTRRRAGLYVPKRFVPHPDRSRHALYLADACSLLGTEHTLRTYPLEYHAKIQLITVSASKLGTTIKTSDRLVPAEREFLWFFGAGVVHKGLDLVLEVFAHHPEWVLNVVGPVSDEADFVALYHHELYELNNIRYNGRLTPSSEEFRAIASRSFCFIAPSCSESLSSAVVTCLNVGLFPIISRDTGVTLPDGCGVYLETNSIDEIEQSVRLVFSLPDQELAHQIATIQNFAAQSFSRERFRADVAKFLSAVLGK
jgi:glycosyltransferase involved in cell wall biosynthesis